MIRNKYLIISLFLILAFPILLFFFWVLRGMPSFTKDGYFGGRQKHYLEHINEYDKLYKSLMTLDSSLFNNRVLRVDASKRKEIPFVFLSDESTSNTFFRKNWYLENDLSIKYEYRFIKNVMEELNLSSVLKLKSQVVLVPANSKYYFSDEFILIKPLTDSLIDNSLRNLSGFKINNNVYVFLKD
jgi:hypothetical protein